MPLKTHQDDMPSINLTPMIDIVFQLIIFFMVGARFNELEKQIDLQVPGVSTNAPLNQAPEKFVVHVFRDGHVALNKDTVSLDELTARLLQSRRERGEVKVTIRGDGEGNFQNVASAMAAVKDAGVEDIGLSVRLAQKGK
jgi:biopolymer transport protein ExbD